MLQEYSALGAEKRMQQWTIRLLHACHILLLGGLLWSLAVLGPGPWLGFGDSHPRSLTALGVLVLAVLTVSVLTLMMTGAMFQVHTLSRKLASIEEAVNSAVGEPVMSWEHADVPAIYYAAAMSKGNFVYRADRVVFPFVAIAQALGAIIAASILQAEYGWGFAGVFLALAGSLMLACGMAGVQLLRFLRTTHRLEDMRGDIVSPMG
jgi:hypothetical protein